MTAWAREPQDEAYDVVVVGAGLGGLSAASLLARSGLRTLVVERNEDLGGYANTFQRGDYRFDPAIHWTPQAGEGNLITAVLEHLGTDDLFDSISLDHMYEAVLPDGVRLRAPTDFEGVIEAHQREFPHEADGIRRYFELARQVHVEGHQMPIGLSLSNMDEAARQFPTFFRLMRSTMAEVLDECLSDPKAKAVCAAPWPLSGTVPSRLSFVIAAQALMNAAEGTYAAKGGFRTLAEALAKGVTDHGGEVVAANGAARIVVGDGHVTEVVLDGGERVRTSTVISNADALQTFHDLVGVEHLPRGFARRLDRMTVAHSAFVLFLGTSLDVSATGPAHETLICPSWDHEAAAGMIAAGEPAGVWVSMPSLADPSLAPPGEHVLVVTALAAYDIGKPWEEHAESYGASLLTLAERVAPGLRDNLTHFEASTPRTLASFASNHGGATYGWEPTVHQAGTKRLPHITPVGGLLLAGHWSLPGSNAIRVVASGVHAAHLAVREQGQEGAIPTFAAAALPSVD